MLNCKHVAQIALCLKGPLALFGHMQLQELYENSEILDEWTSSAHPSMRSSIHSLHSSPFLLCVNSKSFSKSLLSLMSIYPGYKKWITGVCLSYCRRLASSVQSLEFIFYAKSMQWISMQLPCCRFIIYIYIVYLYSSVTILSVHCRRVPPPLFPLMGSFDKDRVGHLWDYWSSIYSEASICSGILIATK